MPNAQDSFLSGSNIDFIEGLYARWLEDPASVDPSWQQLFAASGAVGRPLMGSNGQPAARVNGETAKRPTGDGNGAPALALAPPAATSASVASIQLQARVDQTLYAFRLRGHLLAQLDPLGRP